TRSPYDCPDEAGTPRRALPTGTVRPPHQRPARRPDRGGSRAQLHLSWKHGPCVDVRDPGDLVARSSVWGTPPLIGIHARSCCSARCPAHVNKGARGEVRYEDRHGFGTLMDPVMRLAGDTWEALFRAQAT